MAYNKEYLRKYLRDRYQRRKREAIERLGGVCCRCGVSENLEVDHIEYTEKTMPFSRMYSVSQQRFDEELGRCQLLCKPCHIEKTIDERGYNRRTEHGTYARYKLSKCRCEACRKACRDKTRSYRLKKQQMGFIRKGNKWIASSTGSSS